MSNSKSRREAKRARFTGEKKSSGASPLVLIAGLIATLIVMVDYPIAVTFDADGLTRRTLLRRQRMRWSTIDQLSRSRPGIVAGVRKLAHGGLVAVVGRRRRGIDGVADVLDAINII